MAVPQRRAPRWTPPPLSGAGGSRAARRVALPIAAASLHAAAALLWAFVHLCLCLVHVSQHLELDLHELDARVLVDLQEAAPRLFNIGPHSSHCLRCQHLEGHRALRAASLNVRFQAAGNDLRARLGPCTDLTMHANCAGDRFILNNGHNVSE